MRFSRVVAVTVALAVFQLSGCGPSSSGEASSTITSNNKPDNTISASAAPEEQKTAWIYSTEKDDMRGIVTKTARVESEVAYDGDFGGSDTTSLIIRKIGNRLDVLISNPKLQFMCSSFTDTYVSVKFDDSPIRRFSCVDPETNNYGVAFINSEASFVQEIKKSKRVIIESQVYQKGPVQQTFNVSGLDWN